LRILVVEVEADLSQKTVQLLRAQGHEVEHTALAKTALERLESDPYEAVFLDTHLSDRSGLEVLPIIRDRYPRTFVVMIGEKNTTQSTVVAIRNGAHDCLDKPFSGADLQRVLEGLQPPILSKDAPVRPTLSTPLYLKEYLFLRDACMKDIYERIGHVAKADGVTVLILGETGTGKQHAARLIHHLSERRKAPFLELHCGALPETLLESELFGYEAGAFTDAKKSKPGLMEMAQGGTLFLDEVGELPLTVQAKLLKVLEQKRIRRLGGTRETQLDIRLITATNRDLQGDIKEGRFRADLYYRLNLMSIKMPPLRGRREAIERLTRFFLDEVCAAYEHQRLGLAPAILNAFYAYPWPGNIRELKNLVSRMALSADAKRLDLEHLPDEFRALPKVDVSSSIAPSPVVVSSGVPTFADTERDALLKALEATQWNRTRTAALLGVSRRTIINKIHKWSLVPGVAQV
jgi:DNA-binding NtrC family response regulator